MSDFPNQVQVQPAIGVPGDFASSNPRFTTLAGPGGLVAGPAGVTVGNFAWTLASLLDQDSAPTIVNSFGSGSVAGFVGREMQALITTFLANSTMVIPPGFMVTLYNGGDFLVKNSGTTQALLGQTAYAAFGTGAVTFAASGAPPTASATGSIAANTFSVTASVTNNVMTVTAVGSGTVVPGAVITGTGLATASSVVSQLSGTTGGVGTYAVTPAEQTVASTTVSGTYGTFTAASALSGIFVVGGVLSGSGVTAGTQVTAFGTGTGGLGTYIVNLTQTATSTTITETTAVATKWVAMSSGLAGETIKISDHLLG